MYFKILFIVLSVLLALLLVFGGKLCDTNILALGTGEVFSKMKVVKTPLLFLAYVRYQAKKFEDFKNNFKYKPASGDVHEKNENESFLDSTCVLPFHAQEVNLEY